MNERITGQITSDCHTLIDMNAKPIGMVEIFGAEYETDMATAKRLAACWNACEHLTDEELSEGVVSVAKLRQECSGWKDATAKATASCILDWMTRKEGP